MADNSRPYNAAPMPGPAPTLRNATLYEALLGLRPEYMTPLASSGRGLLAGTPVVIVDSSTRGSLQSLGSIQASTVSEVRFLRSADAVARYGSAFRAGAIVVTTISR